MTELGDRLGRILRDIETELGREARDPQHPHRIFAVAGQRIADHAQCPAPDIFEARGVVHDAEVGDVVVEGVDREVAAPDVLVDRTVDVVAQDPAAVGAFAFVAAVARAAKRRNFDDLAAEAHMREAEPPADQAGVAEKLPDLLGVGIRDDIEVLRVHAEQQVAYAAADDVRIEACVLEPIQDLERAIGDVGAADGVFGAWDDPGAGAPLRMRRVQQEFRFSEFHAATNAAIIPAHPVPGSRAPFV